MKNRITAKLAACVLGLLPCIVHAAIVSHTSTIKWIYPQSNGSVVLTFTSDPASCTATGTPKYLNLVVGSVGVTADGLKNIYSAAMLAATTGTPLTVYFDNATTNCYIARAFVSF